MRKLALPALALLLSACGPLPHPFEQDAPNALIEDRQALSTISIAPVEGAPGLDKALITGFETEDIPASTQPPGPGGLWLRGSRNGGQITWTLEDAQGGMIGTVATAMPPKATPAEIAAAVGHVLRGEDPNAVADERPHVVLAPLKAPKTFDAEGLRNALGRALLREGYAVGEAKGAAAVIQGEVHITPPPPSMTKGQDMLDIAWTIKAPDGKELGKVAQGNPVDHILLTGYLGPLGRAIAEAAAPGIAEVLHKQTNP
ncbi:MAG TPA: hypothetical protein VM661_18840 [Candidatus Sulfotelmatobacter sp.]|nr:hypothetical protein [Candidatus Sulfotelmatobacter sp.]